MKPIKFILAIALGSFGVATHASADTFKIDPVHSSILFSATHLGVSNLYGRFNDVSGTVTFDQADPSKSSVNLTIPIESVDTRVAKRDQQLKGPDFFNGKQFPVMTFKSTKSKAVATPTKLRATSPCMGSPSRSPSRSRREARAKGRREKIRGGGEARFTIKRSDYGMTFMQGPVGDEINVIVSLEGVKE